MSNNAKNALIGRFFERCISTNEVADTLSALKIYFKAILTRKLEPPRGSVSEYRRLLGVIVVFFPDLIHFPPSISGPFSSFHLSRLSSFNRLTCFLENLLQRLSSFPLQYVVIFTDLIDILFHITFTKGTVKVRRSNCADRCKR